MRLEVQPSRTLDADRCNRVNVALSQQDICRAVQLDLSAVLGLEQHSITFLHRAHIRSDTNSLCPHQPLAHLRGGRNHNPSGRLSLAVGTFLLNEDTVVEQLDRELRTGLGHNVRE